MIIVASVFPAILITKERSETQYYARLQKLYDLMVMMSLTVAIPMTFLSNYIINFLYGAAYAEAGIVLAIHIWASVFVFLGVASSRWFLIEGHQLLSLQRTLIGAITNIFLNLWMIKDYGLIGAALATVFSQAIAAWVFDLFQSHTRPMFIMKCKSFNLLHCFNRLYKREGHD
jgi:PST family polysaccharide transporter